MPFFWRLLTSLLSSLGLDDCADLRRQLARRPLEVLGAELLHALIHLVEHRVLDGREEDVVHRVEVPGVLVVDGHDEARHGPRAAAQEHEDDHELGRVVEGDANLDVVAERDVHVVHHRDQGEDHPVHEPLGVVRGRGRPQGTHGHVGRVQEAQHPASQLGRDVHGGEQRHRGGRALRAWNEGASALLGEVADGRVSDVAVRPVCRAWRGKPRLRANEARRPRQRCQWQRAGEGLPPFSEI